MASMPGRSWSLTTHSGPGSLPRAAIAASTVSHVSTVTCSIPASSVAASRSRSALGVTYRILTPSAVPSRISPRYPSSGYMLHGSVLPVLSNAEQLLSLEAVQDDLGVVVPL